MNNSGNFTKNQRSCIKNLRILKVYSAFIAIMGIVGILIGIYSMFFGTIPPGQKLTIYLMVTCMVILFMGCLLYQAYAIIGKLVKTS